MFVCLIVSNKRQNRWTDRAQIFCENPRIIFILFYDVNKENMFRTNLEDGREAPSKASSIKNIIQPSHNDSQFSHNNGDSDSYLNYA